MSVTRFMLLLCFTLLLSGCAALSKKPEQPKISVSDIRLTKADLFEQHYQVDLRIQNPNTFELPLDGLNLTLSLNDQEFVQAMSAQQMTIPKLSSRVITVDAISTLDKLAGQLSQLFLSEQSKTVRYQLDGKIHLLKPVISLPVSNKGSIELF